jgi:hypothetical protein
MNPRSFVSSIIFALTLSFATAALADSSGKCSTDTVAAKAKKAPKKDSKPVTAVVIIYTSPRAPVSMDRSGKAEEHFEMIPTMQATVLPDTDKTDVAAAGARNKALINDLRPSHIVVATTMGD